MRRIELSEHAAAFLRQSPTKQARQIAEKLNSLSVDAEGQPSETLRGYAPMKRLRAGEYRIVFVIDDDLVQIRLIGKRNDDEIYRLLERSRK